MSIHEWQQDFANNAKEDHAEVVEYMSAIQNSQTIMKETLAEQNDMIHDILGKFQTVITQYNSSCMIIPDMTCSSLAKTIKFEHTRGSRRTCTNSSANLGSSCLIYNWSPVRLCESDNIPSAEPLPWLYTKEYICKEKKLLLVHILAVTNR
jgi:hypothetical protein